MSAPQTVRTRRGAGYDDLAEVYERYAGAAARAVWRLGVGAELAVLAPGTPRVLDLGAGTGIGTGVLTELVPGAEVTSLDRSAEMLARGGVPAERRIVADMADFTVEQPFDAVVSGFDSLNYLPPDRLADCLARVADALRPGGHLVFDYCSRRFLRTDADVGASETDLGDGLRLHRRRHAFEEAFSRSRTFLTLYRADEPLWHQHHVHYTVDPFTLEELARGAGLETLLIRNLGDRQFTPGQATHLYVLRRVD
ncbi:class I SAM-dependent methyltransferase [Micromonospora fluostatini]|uniref:Class I SAM-dependent methyltransferase n=1 Tax=Micromonospora fluostatini TaxID=1629071 RepID=A0ABY2DJS7_9ACTN|nr:class I SAM-dependent methyltransferase [Micromonospora fluostatini]